MGEQGGRLLRCSTPDCEYSRSGFPILDGTPVLVDFERSILDRDWVVRSGASSTKRRNQSHFGKLVSRLTTSSGPSERKAREFVQKVKGRSDRAMVLVVGGGVVGFGAAPLYEDQQVSVIGSDIYQSELTDLVADGHHLPFADRSFDGVWIQAVLEHVLEPAQVVDEIRRVLVDGGYVYAETPFLQGVHEGAYDFTRFTPTGHRWLFRGFEEVSSGATRGPATVMVWSIRYLVASLLRSHRAGNMVATLFFWLEYLDRFASPRFALDGPSGVFFLGRRIDRPLRPRDIVATYRGAQRE
jgi:ubiquinone/menaquinone biosynthesis C-methylase UbiE